MADAAASGRLARLRAVATGPRATIARRELASLRSEKTIVLALLIQLFVAAFSSFLVVGLVSLYDPGAVEGFEVEVGVAGNASADVGAVLRSREGVEGQPFDGRRDALEAFHDGRVEAVILANRSGSEGVSVTAFAPEGSLQSTLVVVELRAVLDALEHDLRLRHADVLASSPAPVPRESGASPYFGFTYTVLVPLLVFMPAFISGSIAVDTVTEEIERGTLALLRAAPVTDLDIVEGKMAAAAVLAPGQAALWLGLLAVNGTRVARPLALVGLVAAISLAVVAAGTAVALVSGNRRYAQFVYSTVVLVGFGGAALLPEHPANTVARLAVGSPATATLVSLAGYGVAAVATYLAVRRLVRWRGAVEG